MAIASRPLPPDPRSSTVDALRQRSHALLAMLESHHRRCTDAAEQIKGAAGEMHAAIQKRVETIQRILRRSTPGHFPKLDREYERLLRDRRRRALAAGR